jgi:hypothetical protein
MIPWQKLLSGRFLATVTILIVYFYAAIFGLLTTDQIEKITMLILVFYFCKQRPT